MPAPDLIVRDAVLPDGGTPVDVVVCGERIDAVVPAGTLAGTSAPVEIPARGRLLAPPFVDAHFHLDTALTLGQPRRNRSGTLLEGIAVWSELKPTLTHDGIVERALRWCDLAVARGVLAVRSHVDTCDPRLLAVRALLEVKRRVAPVLELQLVAFPQDGLLRYDPRRDDPSCRASSIDLWRQALDLGVDVVGGIPHFERTADDGRESVRLACEEAARRGLRVDLHCDETDDPASRHVETLAAHAARLGLHGRVAGSHLTSMHSMDNAYAAKLVALIADAGMAVVANPLVNIVLQGRADTYPKRRGLTRVPELVDAGVPVAFGHDCVMDPWYPLGSHDMLEVASMGLHVAQMTGLQAMRACWDAVTTVPAAVLGLDGHGVAPGCRADFVLLHAADPVEAIRLRATRLAVVRRGRVVASQPEPVATLAIDGRPTRIDFLHRDV